MSEPRDSGLYWAFADAVAHKFMVEEGAETMDLPGGRIITHRRDLEHPWPRSFRYRTEVFVGPEDPDAALGAARRQFGDRTEHVVNLFGVSESNRDQLADQLDYTVAWRNVVMERSLGIDEAGERATDVRPVETERDVVAVNLMGPDNPAAPAAISDPNLADFCIDDGGRAVAKGQVVVGLGRIAYVSDMYTAESHRRRGLGTAMMRELEAEAAARGAEQIILVPSLETRRNGFYERLGYRPALSMDVLIPAIAD